MHRGGLFLLPPKKDCMTSAVRSLQFRNRRYAEGKLGASIFHFAKWSTAKKDSFWPLPHWHVDAEFHGDKVASSMGIGIPRFTRNSETRWVCFHPGKLIKQPTELGPP